MEKFEISKSAEKSKITLKINSARTSQNVCTCAVVGLRAGMDIGNLLLIMICMHIVKSSPSPSSSIISPASVLSMPVLLTLSSIAAILDGFVNKYVTLAGLLV
jgi:hypothetical protein